MAATRTPGITIDAAGRFNIDKLHRGTRISLRLGRTTLPLFRDCAARYLAQRHERRSLATMQLHVRLLLPHIGDLEPCRVHDTTLASFISSRVAAGASATTINRSLKIVRTVLNLPLARTATATAISWSRARPIAPTRATRRCPIRRR